MLGVGSAAGVGAGAPQPHAPSSKLAQSRVSRYRQQHRLVAGSWSAAWLWVVSAIGCSAEIGKVRYNRAMRSTQSWLSRCYVWACERLYDELAWSYDWVSRLVSLGRWSRWRRYALDHVVHEPGRILEIGFGTGELLLALAGRGAQVVGLEPSTAMQRVTARKLAAQGRVALRVQARGEAMPFADGSFAAILATFPASYIVDQRTLQECARLLQGDEGSMGRNAGRLIIVGLWVSLRPAWLGRLVPIFYGEPSAAVVAQLEQRLNQAGFTIEWVTVPDGPFAVAVIIAQKLNFL
jgi:SAM-dependent methyltransferase